jgi:hypothetical protein
MNLLARAERDVLIRALVAFTLILAILTLAAVASARAEPAPGREDLWGAVQVSQVASVREGAGRPAGCPRMWCGCWGRLQAGLSDPSFNRALHWLSLKHVTKRVGAWAVLKRRGGGHVGRVVAIDASGNPVLVSGNHSGRVGTATYPKGRVIAYVVP